MDSTLPPRCRRAPPLPTLGGALVLGAEQGHDTLVDLDARDDVALVEQLDEWGAVIGLLVQRLVEQDHAGDVLAELGVGLEEQLAVLAAVVVVVLDADILQALAHGGGRLVGGQDALAGRHDGLRDLAQLLLEGGGGVVEVGSHLGSATGKQESQREKGLHENKRSFT